MKLVWNMINYKNFDGLDSSFHRNERDNCLLIVHLEKLYLYKTEHG